MPNHQPSLRQRITTTGILLFPIGALLIIIAAMGSGQVAQNALICRIIGGMGSLLCAIGSIAVMFSLTALIAQTDAIARKQPAIIIASITCILILALGLAYGGSTLINGVRDLAQGPVTATAVIREFTPTHDLAGVGQAVDLTVTTGAGENHNWYVGGNTLNLAKYNATDSVNVTYYPNSDILCNVE